MKKYNILFADLDGTLINPISKNTFPQGIWDMALNFDAFDAIKKMNPDYVFIVTNQGGIPKFVSECAFETKLNYVKASLQSYCNIKTIDAMYCVSDNKDNIYRKPNIGMLDHLVKFYELTNKEDMLMIGDASGNPGNFSDSDKMAAENFGIEYKDINEFINEYSKQN